MVEFNDFDVEIQNERDSNPEQFTKTVTTAGVSVSVTPTSGKPIQLLYVKNPSKGPNSNNPIDVILVTVDGGANVTTVNRGEYVYIPGVFTSVSLDSNNDGTVAEVIVWS